MFNNNSLICTLHFCLNEILNSLSICTSVFIHRELTQGRTDLDNCVLVEKVYFLDHPDKIICS